jgi:hypothetical protein
MASAAALASFFRALDATAALGTRTRVVVFGNSLIASDGITSVVRERLVRSARWVMATRSPG